MPNFKMLNSRDGEALQYPHLTGSRQTLTAGATTSSATAVPVTQGNLFMLRTLEPIFIRFGTSGVSAAADSNSVLFPAGEGIVYATEGATHFAVIRAGSYDALMQLEGVY